jgi:MFS family permease
MRPESQRVAYAAASEASDRRHAFLVLVCTSAPSFMLQLDANIVSVSLPSIARSLNASFAGIEWVITAYMLSFASLLMPAGALADRFGRKQLLIVGLAVFTLASLLCVRVAAVISDALPGVAPPDRQALIQAVVAGHVSAATLPGHEPVVVRALALDSFADGYRWLFLAAGIFMAASTFLTWRLVSADETRPVSAPVGGKARRAVQ